MQSVALAKSLSVRLNHPREMLGLVAQGLAESTIAQLDSLVVNKKSLFTADQARKLIRRELAGVLEKAIEGRLLGTAPEAKTLRDFLALELSRANAEQSLVQAGVSAAFIAHTNPTDDEELTSEEASKLLHVSRTHVNSLMDSGQLGPVGRTAGGHRRVPRKAVLAYKDASKRRQARGLEAMAEASQRLGLYAGELEGVPRKSKR